MAGIFMVGAWWSSWRWWSDVKYQPAALGACAGLAGGDPGPVAGGDADRQGAAGRAAVPPRHGQARLVMRRSGRCAPVLVSPAGAGGAAGARHLAGAAAALEDRHAGDHRGVRGRAAGAAAAPRPPPYTKVVATGRFDYGREALLGRRGARHHPRRRICWCPLLRDDAPPVLVDRGWVPIERDRTGSTGPRARSPSPAMSARPMSAGLEQPEGRYRPGAASISSTPPRSAPRWTCRRRRPSAWWRWPRPMRRRERCPPRRAACRGRTTRIWAMPSPGTGLPPRWSAWWRPS